MVEDFEPIEVGVFLLGMIQAEHNKRYPKHRCECKNVYAMAAKHFEVHLKENV